MNKGIAKNTFFLYILTFSNYFLGLLLFPFLSRVLSVEKFGLMGFSMSFVLIFQMIIEYGFSILATAEVSQNREDKNKVNRIVSTVIISKICLSFLSILIFIIVSLFLPMIRENLLVVSLFMADSVLKAMLPDFYFRGIEEMKTITIRAVVAKLLSMILAIIFVRGDGQFLIVPLSFIIGNLTALIITLGTMYHKGVRFSKIQFENIKAMLQRGFLFFISRLSVSINSSIGSFFLGLQFSPASIELGILSGITRITVAGEMMLAPINDSIYPHMIKNKDYSLLKKVFIYGGIFWFIGCGIVFIGADSVTAIILGEKYQSAGNYLRILMVNSFFGFFSLFLGYPTLSPIGKSNYANLAIPLATSISIILFSLLWWFNKITLVNVLVVMSSMNVMLVIFRGSALYKFKHLIKKRETN